MYSEHAVQCPDLWIPHILLQQPVIERWGAAVALCFHLGSGRGLVPLGAPCDCRLSRAGT